jgi:hypothetical protein
LHFEQVSAPQLTLWRGLAWLGLAWLGLACWEWEIRALCHTRNDDNDDDDGNDDSNNNNNESLMEKCEYIKKKIR